MRNYRFAIVPYAPRDEYRLRSKVQSLVGELTANGWVVLTLSLQKLLLDRIRQLGADIIERMIRMERRTADISAEKGLNYLSQKIYNEIEGPDGLSRRGWVGGAVVRCIGGPHRSGPWIGERVRLLRRLPGLHGAGVAGGRRPGYYTEGGQR